MAAPERRRPACVATPSIKTKAEERATMIAREPMVDELECIVGLWNQERPQDATTTAKLSQRLAIPSAYLKPGGVVVEEAGAMVGFGTYRWSQHATGQPVKFWIGSMVSEGERVEVLDAICRGLEQIAAEYGQDFVYAIVREDDAKRVELYRQRGYREQMRSFGATLEVQHFDDEPYRGHAERLRAAGIEIKTLEELESGAADMESLRSKLFDLYSLTALDSPDVGGSGLATQDEYVRENLAAQRTLRDAYFVAVQGDELVGLSELFANGSPDRLDTGATVVRREYRRRGIGLGLKLRAIAYAQAHKARVITTGFAAENQSSVNLNLKLGFVCEPSWITFRKSLVGSSD